MLECHRRVPKNQCDGFEERASQCERNGSFWLYRDGPHLSPCRRLPVFSVCLSLRATSRVILPIFFKLPFDVPAVTTCYGRCFPRLKSSRAVKQLRRQTGASWQQIEALQQYGRRQMPPSSTRIRRQLRRTPSLVDSGSRAVRDICFQNELSLPITIPP